MISIVLLNMTVYAEVVTDGTMGPVTTLTDDMIISEQLGQQVGNNLFHSFETFNVNTGERATFTGPLSIANILARVTGQNHSWIDGPLRVDIPNANLYLLNPNGILFGKHARLDISGSFHVSTADYLRLGEQGRFSATHPNHSVLVTAPPEAFGFLDSDPGSITIQGSFIKTDGGKTLSFIGGDLQIEDSILFASGGRINLAAVASAGEVTFTNSDLAVNTFEKLGTIKLSQTSSKYLQEWSSSEMLEEMGFGFELANIDVSDLKTLGGAGQIFIRAGQFIANKGFIFADTYGNEKGLGIDIFIDGDMHLINGARITADNFGNSSGSNITIRATQGLFLSGRNEEIPINSLQNFINSFSTIATNNKKGFSKENIGNGGNIFIETPILGMALGLIQSATETKGNAGNIVINAQQLFLKEFGYIDASTNSFGQAGYISITADEITLSNVSSISTSTDSNSSGNAGDIYLTTQQLTLKNGSQINSFSKGSGNAGPITITAENVSLLNRSAIITLATQRSGNDVSLKVGKQLQISDSYLITRTTSGTQEEAGDVTIETEGFLLDSSQLLANALVGEGGNINILTDQLTITGDSWIDVSSKYGVNGQLILNAVKITDDFFALPLATFQGIELSLSRCAGLSRKDFSFTTTIRDVLPPTPEDFRM